MYTLKRIPNGGAGFYYFLAWSLGKLNLIENYPSNAGHWNESFSRFNRMGCLLEPLGKLVGTHPTV